MQIDTTDNQEMRDIGGIVVAVIMILLATLAIWDTTEMVDADSFIFPRAVAIAMISFSLLFIVMQFHSPSMGINDEAGLSGGSTLRRMGLVMTMIGCALLMPWLGFMISGMLAFASIMMLAMYDEWTAKRRLVFSLSGIVIVIGFYFMFAKLLLVPLPVGFIFE